MKEFGDTIWLKGWTLGTLCDWQDSLSGSGTGLLQSNKGFEPGWVAECHNGISPML